VRELGARSLATKLQVPAGSAVRVINPPRGFKIDAPASSKDGAGAVLLFTKKSADLSVGKAVLEAARQDRIAWVAYPKAGKLGTDLNRDRLWTLLEPEGIRPVRIVSIDETWAALRFRPAQNIRRGEGESVETLPARPETTGIEGGCIVGR